MKINAKLIAVFFLGFALALVVGVVIFIFSFVNQVRNYGIMFAPEVYTDQQVREAFCRGNGCLPELPPTSHKLIFVQGGGCDPTYFKAFTASKDDCEKFITDFSRENSALTKKDFSCELTKDPRFPATFFHSNGKIFLHHYLANMMNYGQGIIGG